MMRASRLLFPLLCALLAAVTGGPAGGAAEQDDLTVLKADPKAVPYHQPDFRPFAQIDAAGGAEPIPFALVMRRVRRETEPYIPGDELRATVAALYRMYSTTMRPQDMTPLWTQLREDYPPDGARVALVPPTKT